MQCGASGHRNRCKLPGGRLRLAERVCRCSERSTPFRHLPGGADQPWRRVLRFECTLHALGVGAYFRDGPFGIGQSAEVGEFDDAHRRLQGTETVGPLTKCTSSASPKPDAYASRMVESTSSDTENMSQRTSAHLTLKTQIHTG